MHILQPDTYKHLNVKNFASQDASLSCKRMNEDKECNFTAFGLKLLAPFSFSLL